MLDIHPDDRVTLLVDGQNVYGSFANTNLSIDFKELINEFGELRLNQALYFTPDHSASGEHNSLRPLLDFLSLNGFRVTDPRKERGSNTNVELAVRAMTMAATTDVFVLMSGNSDFAALVEALGSMGKRVIVMHHSESTSMELRRVADEYIALDKINSKIISPRQGRSAA